MTNGNDYLEKLNTAQRAAVEYLGGPQLVIAGAGSGKTRVLTYKIAHLLAQGCDAGRILALTFTNKAANEMRQRVCSVAGESVAARLWMGTFHSIFSRMLRRHADRLGFRSDFTIYDTSDSKSLVKSIIKELKLDDKAYRPGHVLSDISWAKNALYSPADYASDRELMRAAADAGRPRTAEIYRIYSERCRIASAMDFDDLLFFTNVLLRDNPDILEHYRNYFAYVLVDEYQDTNFAQHMIVRQLCATHGRLCVVGDDAQSIYSFRGANIRNILDLKKSFPTLETFKLEQNYRSTGNIVDAANSLIACNREQIPKEVFSKNGSGEKIDVIQCYNENEEGFTVANNILRMRMKTGDRWSDFAILYRTNAQSRVLEEHLRNRNIPYRVFGGLAYYQRKEIKDAVSYFRLAVNPSDDEALKRIINTPRRGIGDTTLGKLSQGAMAMGVSIFEVLDGKLEGLGFNKGTIAKLNAFRNLIAEFVAANSQGISAPEIARLIIERTGLLKEYIVSGDTPENISKRDNLLELIKAVDEASEAYAEQNGDTVFTMGEFLATVSLLTDADTQAVGDDAVTLMTIHSAKGLEFDCVYLVGAEEELLPSSMSIHSRDAARQIEEERRLMYVAITRAKRHCTITFASHRAINGKTGIQRPSRFLGEIDIEYLNPASGARLPQQRRQEHSPAASNIRVQASAAPTVRQAVSDGNHTLHHSSALAEGVRINHPRFGQGTIQGVDTTGSDHTVLVLFDGEPSPRKLLLKFAKFSILQ